MIRHLRVAAVPATLLSLALLAGCGDPGTSGAADDAHPTGRATTPTKAVKKGATKAGTNGGATAAWTAKGLRAALPEPAAIQGVRGYAPGGRPRVVKVRGIPGGKHGGGKACRFERADYVKAGRPKRGASASYLGASPIPLFSVGATGWPTAAAAAAAMAAGQELELCEDEDLTIEQTTQGRADITTYTDPSAGGGWTIARFTVGSAGGSVVCLATEASEHKVCNRALRVAARKLAATKPH